MNEAIEIIKKYGDETSRVFVNGILGKIVNEILGEVGEGTVIKRREEKNFVGALVYAIHNNTPYFVFIQGADNKWQVTRSMISGQEEKEECKKTVFTEIGLVCQCEEKIGGNSFVNHTPEAIVKKKGVYYLAKAPYGPLTLKKSGGLKDVKWFTAEEALALTMHKDVRDMFHTAIREVSERYTS